MEDKKNYLNDIYQEMATFVKKQFPSNPIEDIDVGVAVVAAKDGYSNYDIRLILLRSPKSQDLKQASKEHGFDNMSDYIEQRKAIALTEIQLAEDPKLRERVDILKPIIDNFCKPLPFEDEIDDKDYSMKKLGDTRTITAHDGRGEVLKLTGQWVEKCCLMDKDVRVFQQIEANLAEFNRQEQEPMQSRTNKPKLKQKQMEL